MTRNYNPLYGCYRRTNFNNFVKSTVQKNKLGSSLYGGSMGNIVRNSYNTHRLPTEQEFRILPYQPNQPTGSGLNASGLNPTGGDITTPITKLMNIERSAELPIDQFKKKILKNLKKSNPSVSADRDLGRSYNMKNPTLPNSLNTKSLIFGSGVSKSSPVYHSKKVLHKYISSDLIPEALKSIDLTVPKKTIEKVTKSILKPLKSANLYDLAKYTTKGIMKLLPIKNITGGSIEKLKNTLLKAVHNKFKAFINQQLQKRKIPIMYTGKGCCQKVQGGSFWKGFKKGFRMVTKPGFKIIGSLATKAGQPELGVPLSVLGDVL